MPLSWNEIKTRANAFSQEWQDESREDAEAKSFWDAFFNVFGISRRRIASFEEPVKKSDDKGGFIDLLWRGQLLVEHKSRGKSLDKAFTQALDYFPGLKERDLPKFILVSDFAKFRLYNLETNEQVEFSLKDLYQNVKLFGFIAGYTTQIIKPQDPINIKAAERMGKLHDALKAVGYQGHALEVYLVRLLFCLFAEDTTIYEKRLFQDYIETKTSEDGSDLAHHLSTLFYVLNTPENKRLNNLDESLAAFPYVNGKLFEETLPPAQFDSKMREALLDLCALDWSIISPAIFGSLFQSIMDADARRNLGAHYTSEENILKLIKPLFLDALWAEFDKVKNNKNKLQEFHNKLRKLNFLDPACGCGNFLVITYRELRLLELQVLRASHKTGQLVMDVQALINVDVDQFYGIEIEEFPAQIAQVALWLTDHQMNMKISEEFGNYFARIPLKATPHITFANALQTDWSSVLALEKCSFILGNPPFLGKKEQSTAQKNDFLIHCNNIKGAGILDFVSAWYIKAANYMQKNQSIKCAFVSTNSITQGEQVGVLWGWMLAQGVKIHFAHRTFSWSNEARGKAAVHCVIIGFGLQDVADKTIYEYADIKAEPHAIKANNINPYLVDADNLLLSNNNLPICNVPTVSYGSFALDDGNYTLTEEEKDELIKLHPKVNEYIRPFIGGQELIRNQARYCLWLQDAKPEVITTMPALLKRIQAVQNWRKNSERKTTQNLAATPMLFAEIRQPLSNYLAFPTVSSERRAYIPIAFLDSNVIASNQIYIIPKATYSSFGTLTSTMHMAWVRSVCGRLKSDFRYSAGIVYNNFPWPEPTEKQTQTIESAAKAVLAARAAHPNASLADLYDPLTMPAILLKAHQVLDKAVDAAYGYKGAQTDASRVAFLFARYQQITSLLPVEKAKKSRKKTA
ncbi:MAG: DNA methyltransferase [Methylotenera sp.]|nr:class I SAM-dependent DNA methyltransferase [Methylotenera sp.]HPM48263.1 class I SAM-dependent DNA methyltransferase [Methylotenera sp.]